MSTRPPEILSNEELEELDWMSIELSRPMAINDAETILKVVTLLSTRLSVPITIRTRNGYTFQYARSLRSFREVGSPDTSKTTGRVGE